jgi:SAM-dependent methyltransferase
MSAPPTVRCPEPDAVLRGYDRVVELYPHLPSLSHWRAWECAAYEGFRIDGSVLDLGCGDGRYFHLLWPEARDVVGVDHDEAAAALGRASGIYRQVHVAAAHAIPEKREAFDHVFANCSLEHMDHLDAVLGEIQRCLRPGGSLLCSVVTHRFVDWAFLPRMLRHAGHEALGDRLHEEFMAYHHLANPLAPGEWLARFARAGLEPIAHVPILPRFNSAFFLMTEGAWHLRAAGGPELGATIHPFLSGNARFPTAFRDVIQGLMGMETDPFDCSGAVFHCRKPG